MSYRQFAEDELVLASHNPGKLREIAALFADQPFRVTSAQDYDLPEPEETEVTFSGNALLKAWATSFATDKPALADDSGLVIPALNGAPGIYSARWAGPNKDFIMSYVFGTLGSNMGGYHALTHLVKDHLVDRPEPRTIMGAIASTGLQVRR